MAAATGPAATVPATPSKMTERFLALGTALVLIATFGGGIAAFICVSITNTAIKQSIITGIITVVGINFALSLFVWIWKGVRGAASTNSRTYWTASLTTLSFVWDLVALILAIFAFSGAGVFIYLGIVLIVDAIIDGIVHFVR